MRSSWSVRQRWRWRKKAGGKVCEEDVGVEESVWLLVRDGEGEHHARRGM
jgi:hypothetical protein